MRVLIVINNFIINQFNHQPMSLSRGVRGIRGI